MKKLLTFLAVFAILTCNIGCPPSKSSDKETKDKGGDEFKLEVTELVVEPTGTAETKAKTGEAKSVEVPEDTKKAGVTADVKDGKVKVESKDAKPGDYKVTVKSTKDKTTELKVKVKKKEEASTEEVKLDPDTLTVVPGKGGEVKVMGGKEIDLPMETKEAKVTATIADGKVKVETDKETKEGKYKVMIKGAKDKVATLTVEVKK